MDLKRRGLVEQHMFKGETIDVTLKELMNTVSYPIQQNVQYNLSQCNITQPESKHGRTTKCTGDATEFA